MVVIVIIVVVSVVVVVVIIVVVGGGGVTGSLIHPGSHVACWDHGGAYCPP